MSTKATVLEVEGMTCSACVRRVEQALRGFDDITKLDVKIGKVRVEHDPMKTTPERLVAAIVDAGYEARPGA